MSTVRVRADLTVLSKLGRPVAAVEVKNPRGLTEEAATQVRRNFIVHGMLDAAVPYFMVASQDVGYVWDGAAADDPDAPPRTHFSMAPVVERHVSPRPEESRLSGFQLEVAIANWFWELMDEGRGRVAETEPALREIGLIEAIRGGSVELNAES